MADLKSDWKRLSTEYLEARERFEAASAAMAVYREGYVTPSAAEITEETAARAGVQAATYRLYEFVGRVDLSEADRDG